MTGTLPDVLARIVEHKRTESVFPAERLRTLELEAEARLPGRRDFRAALTANPPAVIAEFKKASPSKGLFAPGSDPATVARAYEAGGAAAMSVLTDARFFQGSFADLEAARAACGIPILRKDFTLEEAHVIEAAAHGADAILLIAAILPSATIRRLAGLAAEYRMASLVEVHDAAELEVALEAGAEIIGVNNRDLRTFRVELETSLRLAERIPADAVKVAESGIHSAADVRTLLDAGFHAFLVGEHLMTAPDPAGALRALRS